MYTLSINKNNLYKTYFQLLSRVWSGTQGGLTAKYSEEQLIETLKRKFPKVEKKLNTLIQN